MHKIAMHHLQRKFSVAASFKLVRTNLFPDNGNVFDYTLDQKGEQETRCTSSLALLDDTNEIYVLPCHFKFYSTFSTQAPAGCYGEWAIPLVVEPVEKCSHSFSPAGLVATEGGTEEGASVTLRRRAPAEGSSFRLLRRQSTLFSFNWPCNTVSHLVSILHPIKKA